MLSFYPNGKSLASSGQGTSMFSIDTSFDVEEDNPISADHGRDFVTS
jgi:hypothetical protein